jgi:HD superfamily phosphohydrolase YqeK/uncharacterized membrane protein
MKDLSVKLKLFLISLYLLTVGFILVFSYNTSSSVDNVNFLEIAFFVILLALCESFVVEYKDVAVTSSFAVHLAAVILFKPLAAIIITILGISISVFKANNRYIHIFNTPIYKILYNYCAYTLPILFGSLAYIIIGGTFGAENLGAKIPHIIVFCFVFFILNTLITSMLFSLLHNKSILYFFKANIKLGLLSNVAMAPFGVCLAFIFNNYNYLGVLLVVLPILLARYTFSLYIETKTQYAQTVDSLMRAMEARDKYTEGHSQRVAEISEQIAKELKFSDERIERINMASMLHDVGKIGIDDSILNKPDKLTNEEFNIIKTHPQIGYSILEDIENLKDILPMIRNHHERYDGKGYPDGKKAEELPLDVYVIQLADTIDAMATDRPYRKAQSEEYIISEINKYSGTQFHPKVVEAYLNILRKQGKLV